MRQFALCLCTGNCQRIETKCGDIMFAQKKKKSKLWLVIPVLLALAAGLWLNSGLESENTSVQGGEDDAIQAGSDQYEDISDLSGIPDSSVSGDSSRQQDEISGNDNDSNRSYPSDSAYDENIGGNTSEGFSNDTSDENRNSSNAGGISSGQNGKSGQGDQKDQRDQNKTSPSDQYAGKILVIADNDGNIVIYKYDSKGNVTSESETEIQLSMLTETDKQLFTKGITVGDESELSELLQDFEG